MDLRCVRAGPDAPDTSVSIVGEVVARCNDICSRACREGFINVALQAVPIGCVGRVGPNSKGGIGEWPVRDALVGTGAISSEARVGVKDGRIDEVARVLSLIPPAAETRQWEDVS